MILLASTSPRRRDLLQEAGIPFQVEPSQIAELSGGDWSARELCVINADRKASEVATRFPDQIVLGADTLVTLDDRVYGKPGDLAEAQAMLETLCGRVHEVVTGVCLVRGREICRFVDITRVKFRPRAEVDIEEYFRHVDPLDKAGAYAAQEDEGRLIEQIEGSMSNVVGLPMERLLQSIQDHFPEVWLEGE